VPFKLLLHLTKDCKTCHLLHCVLLKLHSCGFDLFRAHQFFQRHGAEFSAACEKRCRCFVTVKTSESNQKDEPLVRNQEGGHLGRIGKILCSNYD